MRRACATAFSRVCTEESASRPISRVLCLNRSSGDDHSSGPCVAAWFSRPTRVRARGWARTPDQVRGRCTPIRSCSRRGLPCRLPYGRRGGLLPHRFTLTIKPQLSGGLFSVALSLKLPSAGVTRRRIRVEPGLSSNAAFRLCARGRPADWRRQHRIPSAPMPRRTQPGAPTGISLRDPACGPAPRRSAPRYAMDRDRGAP